MHLWTEFNPILNNIIPFELRRICNHKQPLAIHHLSVVVQYVFGVQLMKTVAFLQRRTSFGISASHWGPYSGAIYSDNKGRQLEQLKARLGTPPAYFFHIFMLFHLNSYNSYHVLFLCYSIYWHWLSLVWAAARSCSMIAIKTWCGRTMLGWDEITLHNILILIREHRLVIVSMAGDAHTVSFSHDHVLMQEICRLSHNYLIKSFIVLCLREASTYYAFHPSFTGFISVKSD